MSKVKKQRIRERPLDSFSDEWFSEPKDILQSVGAVMVSHRLMTAMWCLINLMRRNHIPICPTSIKWAIESKNSLRARNWGKLCQEEAMSIFDITPEVRIIENKLCYEPRI